MSFVCKLSPSESAKAVEDRRWLHQHAELSNQEFETTAYIEKEMSALGLEIFKPGKTGLIAVLKGAYDGPTLGIRADIDALPLQELNDVPYRSQHDNVMHACGHDAHGASPYGRRALSCGKPRQDPRHREVRLSARGGILPQRRTHDDRKRSA